MADATSEVVRREHETLLRLARAGEYRDEDTGNHVIRMAKYARLIAEELGMSEMDSNRREVPAPVKTGCGSTANRAYQLRICLATRCKTHRSGPT